MPSPDLIFNAAVFAAIAVTFAALTVALRRDLLGGSITMTVLLLIGVGGLWLLARFGAPLGDGTVMVVLREIALALTALGFIRLTLTFLLNALLRRLALPRILGELGMIVMVAGYTLYRMDAVGVNLAGIITTSAVVTGVIAFSLKETLGNLWGGIGLQLDNTCRMGDWIRIEGVTGQVVGIRMRYLSVATNNGETVIIPNGHLITNKVNVLSRRGDERIPTRREIDFTVSYATPPSRVIAVVEAALARAEIHNVAAVPAFVEEAVVRAEIRRSLPMPRFIVACRNFADNGVDYQIYYWLTDITLENWTDSQVRLHVAATLARNGMEIPYPHRVLIEGKVPEADEVRERSLDARVATLSRIPLFAALTDAERRALASELADCPFVVDDVITRQGEAADSLYILASGAVAFYDDSPGGTGKRDLLAKLGAPDVFGEMGLLTGQPRGATAIAEGDVHCYRLDKEGFDAILKARPQLVEPMSQVVAARQTANDAKLHALSADARARQTSSRAAELVRRIRGFFSIS
jgi:small-conductance mechanosensitive channel/CRP-like cAMP-binding protein